MAVIGSKPSLITLAEPDPAWVQAFDDERERLRSVLSRGVRAIEHYGSTAVRGLRAKPIIDILVGIDTLDRWTECGEPLRRLGYDYFEDAGVPGHHIFFRENKVRARTHLLHVVAFGSTHWTLNLGFRDRLRAEPELRRQYEAVKQRAACQAPFDRRVYNALKSEFIQDVMAGLHRRNVEN